jgi:hypothetical protein
MRVIRQTRDLSADQIYQLYVNFDVKHNVFSAKGSEIREILAKANDISFIMDKRLDLCALMPASAAIEDGEVLLNYVDLLARVVNKRTDLPNQQADSLVNLGYVLAFASPSCYANEIQNFETVLTRIGVKPTKIKAFKPSSPYPLMDSMDLWVSKIDIAPFVGKEGSEHLVTSSDVVSYILTQLKED